MPGPKDYEKDAADICNEIKKLALEIIERKRAIRKKQMELLMLDEGDE